VPRDAVSAASPLPSPHTLPTGDIAQAGSTTSGRELAAVFVLFSILTCLFTAPQVFHLGSQVGPHYDALFGVWRLAWIAHQLRRDPAHLFDANIFYPETHTLTFSDAIPLLGFAAAPGIWLGVSPVVAYNLLVLLSFPASGLAMYVLARTLTASRLAALVAGMCFTFQPYRIAHFAQIELLWTCWIPMAFLALHRVTRAPSPRAGVSLGLAVVGQVGTCLYYAVYLLTVLPVLFAFALVRRPVARLSSLWQPLAIAAVIVLVCSGPYVAMYLGGYDALRERSRGDLAVWSLTLQNYLGTTPTSLLYRTQPSTGGPFEGVLFPGGVAVGLAIMGIARTQWRDTIPYLVLLIVCVDLSLGINGFLYLPLSALLSPYQGLRAPGRMFVMVSACLAVLAAYGVRAIVDGSGRGRVAIASALAVAVLAEGLAVPQPLNALPRGPGRVYAWLARQPPSVVVEWPLPKPNALGITREPDYMYFSTSHWQPLVNGYSGRYPASYVEFLHRVAGFPDAPAISFLRRRGVRYVLLRRDADPIAYDAAVDAAGRDRRLLIVMRERWDNTETVVFQVPGV
jgi:hypothetical protein